MIALLQEGISTPVPNSPSGSLGLSRTSTAPAVPDLSPFKNSHDDITKIDIEDSLDREGTSPVERRATVPRDGTMPVLVNKDTLPVLHYRSPAQMFLDAPARTVRRLSSLAQSWVPGTGQPRNPSEFKAGQKVLHEIRGLGTVKLWDCLKGTVTVAFHTGDIHTYSREQLLDGRLQPLDRNRSFTGNSSFSSDATSSVFLCTPPVMSFPYLPSPGSPASPEQRVPPPFTLEQ
eukprot:Hpha_TRINITY_DN15568_c1_g3::TRINITY_DN15568_c1_g3_i1::g.109180::m.109180